MKKLPLLVLIIGFCLNAKAQKYSIVYEMNPHPPYNFATDMLQDLSGNIWISTDDGGIAKYNGTNWKFFVLPGSHPLRNICNTITAIGDTIWIGTEFNYLCKFTPDENITKPLGCPSSGFYSLVADKNNLLWMGLKDPSTTFDIGIGLTGYNGKIWKNYNTTNSNLELTQIRDLAIDARNNLWLVGDSGLNERIFKGAVKFDGNNFTYFNTRNSTIPTDSILGVAAHPKNGDVWLAHSKGLTKIDTTNTLLNIPVNELGGSIVKFGIANIWNLAIDSNGILHTSLQRNQTNFVQLNLNTETLQKEIYDSTVHFFFGKYIRSYLFDKTGNKTWYSNGRNVLLADYNVSVFEKSLDAQINIYPNPTSTHFYIDNSHLELNKLLIYSIDGRLIDEIKINHVINQPITTCHLQNGAYIVVLFTREEKSYQYKLLINHQ